MFRIVILLDRPMKALLINPGHSQTFWSFDKVLKLTGKKALLPPLGLLTLAAIVPDDWQVELVDMVFQKISETQWDQSDIIMISGMSVQKNGILEVIREGKTRGKTVIVGGPWSFHAPEQAFAAGADIVVKGEAEHQISELLKSINKRDFGRIIQSSERPDMTLSPMPRYELLEMESYVDMGIQFTRGCPFKCEFCDVTLMLGRKVRAKKPFQILRELESLYSLGWRRMVFFSDDNFIGNIHKTKELLNELIPWMENHKHPFNFYTQASVNMASDDKLMEDMYRAGFNRVFLGVETPDEVCLKDAGKLQNTNVDLSLVCQKIAKAGFQVIAGAILGFDEEKSGAGTRLINFAEQNHIPELFTTLLQAGQGTDLCKRLETENRLLTMDDDNVSNQTGLVNFIPTRPLQEIADEFITVYATLYKPETYIERSYMHFASMNPPKVNKPLKLPYLWELRAAFITIFRNGLVYPTRIKFWRCLLNALCNFPTRLDRFLASLVVAEHYYEFREKIRAGIESQLAELDPALNTTCYVKPHKVAPECLQFTENTQ
ncbi:MAG: B12-binding domain-containing radical SAM protein [Pseudomonadota bacterium]